jgi:hypothetical protein
MKEALATQLPLQKGPQGSNNLRLHFPLFATVCYQTCIASCG